ncbi:Ion transport 2 domain protein [Aciduliprofundum boonei T469]|uniref:Ion transport 2 domain protein n=1 Tax=Aciduliprofundum boonei (strain DSM 19572 / T469) TaxID=439481 RepID=B5IFR0_ACIB4|nr:Ion transport 2 domain protein [Aciduliprofundum boonei T469]EDY34911.1 Ion channel family [Aciduliprofundum boonei T469]HII55722.1 two pore domain potassium channel family protein [Candidatus Aciduliprofundum boonei]
MENIKNSKKPVFSKIKDYIFTIFSVGIEFLLADLTCEYGTNWKRPVWLWVGAVLVVFPLLYWFLGGIVGASSPWDYWYFSIVTATTLGYGDMHPIGYAKVFASLEAIFGMFMWAVFLTVFARKYMR